MSRAEDRLPKSPRTIKADLDTRYTETKGKVAALLGEVRSKIHIAVDAWSSPNGHAMLG